MSTTRKTKQKEQKEKRTEQSRRRKKKQKQKQDKKRHKKRQDKKDKTKKNKKRNGKMGRERKKNIYGKNVDIKLRINLRKKQFHDICTVVYITGYMYHKSLKSVKKQQQLEKYYIFLLL